MPVGVAAALQHRCGNELADTSDGPMIKLLHRNGIAACSWEFGRRPAATGTTRRRRCRIRGTGPLPCRNCPGAGGKATGHCLRIRPAYRCSHEPRPPLAMRWCDGTSATPRTPKPRLRRTAIVGLPPAWQHLPPETFCVGSASRAPANSPPVRLSRTNVSRAAPVAPAMTEAKADSPLSLMTPRHCSGRVSTAPAS
jgi:hypothetical protein